jgi:hypothetical protein
MSSVCWSSLEVSRGLRNRVWAPTDLKIGTGGGLSAAGKSVGTKITILGLVIQVLAFLCFTVTALLFIARMDRVPTAKSANPMIPWRTHLKFMLASSLLIFVRSIVRLIEYAQGFSGYVISHEGFLYGFDFLLMVVVAGLFFWFHPSELNALLKGGRVMRGLKVVGAPTTQGSIPMV